MDYKFLINRFLSILFKPGKAWGAIQSENRPLKDSRNSFLLPLILIVTLAAFAGSLLLTRARLSFIYSIFTGIKYFVLLLVVTFASAFIHKEMTYAMDLGRDFSASFKLIVYSLVPLFVCLTISCFFESLIFINILSFYGLYIYWKGSKAMLNPQQHKRMPLLIATVVIISEIYVLASVILSHLADRVYFAIFAR